MAEIGRYFLLTLGGIQTYVDLRILSHILQMLSSRGFQFKSTKSNMNPERREPQEKKLIETVGLPITAEEAPDFILKELLKRRILAEGEQPGYKIFLESLIKV